jgi:hypothetical protein
LFEVFRHFSEFWDRVEAEHKLHIVVMPSIKVARLRKVRIALHQDLSKARATTQINAAIEEDVGTFVRRSIAWSVPQIKQLASVGERHNQRMPCCVYACRRAYSPL